MRSPVLSKTAALLQITAILLIQFYAVAPLFSRRFIAYAHVVKCTGDHAKCRCSPERIAAHTCCCYQSKRLGFMTSASGCCNRAPKETRPAAPAACALPDAGTAVRDCCNRAMARPEPPTRNDSGHSALESPGKAGCCATPPESGPKSGTDEHNRLIPSLCSVPCGDDPASIPVSLENIKFLRPQPARFVPAACSAGYPFLPRTAYQGRCPEPPDPPPRISSIS